MDYFKALTLKTSNIPTVSMMDGEVKSVRKGLYHILIQTLYRTKVEILDLIDTCENYKYTEDDFHKTFPEDYNKHLVIEGRLWVLRQKYTDKFTDLRFASIIYSLIVVEGLITEYLLLKADSKNHYKKLIESYSVIEKWKLSPAKLILNYHLPYSLETTLTELNFQRRCIIHNEPFLEIKGKIINQGRNIKKKEQDMTAELLSFIDLPSKLVENLIQFDNSAATMGLNSLIESYSKIAIH